MNPRNHTTSASHVLKWPAVRSLMEPLLLAEGVEWIDTYPQHQEARRDQRDLFGNGKLFHELALYEIEH